MKPRVILCSLRFATGFWKRFPPRVSDLETMEGPVVGFNARSERGAHVAREAIGCTGDTWKRGHGLPPEAYSLSRLLASRLTVLSELTLALINTLRASRPPMFLQALSMAS